MASSNSSRVTSLPGISGSGRTAAIATEAEKRAKATDKNFILVLCEKMDVMKRCFVVRMVR